MDQVTRTSQRDPQGCAVSRRRLDGVADFASRRDFIAGVRSTQLGDENPGCFAGDLFYSRAGHFLGNYSSACQSTPFPSLRRIVEREKIKRSAHVLMSFAV
jgi:hypothetical protein